MLNLLLQKFQYIKEKKNRNVFMNDDNFYTLEN